MKRKPSAFDAPRTARRWAFLHALAPWCFALLPSAWVPWTPNPLCKGGIARAARTPDMKIDRTHIQQTFASYVHDYDADNPRIALKIEHSQRVAELCGCIAQSEGFSPEDCDLAWALGLLHDIGRFEQLRRWNTFSDAKSTSHAALGVHLLFDQKEDAPLGAQSIRLRDFIEDPSEDEMIREAVGRHSDYRLPDDLPARTHRFCAVVRDADKIDILRTVQESTPQIIMGSSYDELASSALSPAVLKTFRAHRCVKRAERIHPADYVVGFLCFVFELEFPASRKAALQQGIVFEMAQHPFGMEQPFSNPKTQQAFKDMEAQLHEWLK